MTLPELAAMAKEYGRVGRTAGKQERLENIVNRYLLNL
jgi:xylose isomerase